MRKSAIFTFGKYFKALMMIFRENILKEVRALSDKNPSWEPLKFRYFMAFDWHPDETMDEEDMWTFFAELEGQAQIAFPFGNNSVQLETNAPKAILDFFGKNGVLAEVLVQDLVLGRPWKYADWVTASTLRQRKVPVFWQKVEKWLKKHIA